jgi:predicted phosphodiesterase
MKSFLKNIFSDTNTTDKTTPKDAKYLIIPDLHGTYSIYKKIEQYIKTECEDDRVIIFLGDYLDRGESMSVYGREFHDGGSFHTLKALLNLKTWATQHQREVVFLRGNHEIIFED